MKTKVLSDLVTLARTQLIKQQQRAKPGLNVLRELRAQSATIDELDRRSKSSADMHQLRAIGADVLWRGWLDRQRRELNTQLARHLAEQDHILRDLRKAQGQHDALVSLLEDAESNATQRVSRARDVQLLESALRSRR